MDAAQRTTTPVEPGTTVDHFKVVRQIGRGGMGEVYLARDTKLGRKVALEFVAGETLRDRMAQRLPEQWRGDELSGASDV